MVFTSLLPIGAYYAHVRSKLKIFHTFSSKIIEMADTQNM